MRRRGGGSAPTLLRLERWGDKAAKQLRSEAAKHNLDAKTKRIEDVKKHSLLGLRKFDLFRKIVDILSLVKRNILLSPLEGEKKFLGELCELRNFREGYKKYKTLDRATECAIVCVGDKKGKIKMNENSLQQKQPNNPVASPETNHSPLTIHHSPKRIAFTLAEVLITLGVIGVVAALTLPSVVNNFKRKSFETQFKTVDSLLQQAFRKSVNELGYSDVSEFTIPGSATHKYFTEEKWAKLKEEAVELNEIWLSQFKIVKKVTFSELFHKGIGCYDVLGTTLPYHWWCFNDAYILSNGASITGVSAQYGGINHPGQITYSFDINGPYKGPNRLGYDLFTFYSYEGYSKMCDPTIRNSSNQDGCYYYAHRNTNPVYKEKDYWDILFKPKSYWQKKTN